MRDRTLKNLLSYFLTLCIVLVCLPVYTNAQVNNADSMAYRYTQKPDSDWSQGISLNDGEYFLISLTPEADRTWVFESKGNSDTYCELWSVDDPNGSVENPIIATADEGGATAGNFKLTYDLKAGCSYTLRISGYADSAANMTVYATTENEYTFEALSDQVIVLNSPLISDSQYPSECTLDVVMLNAPNNFIAYVTWFYIDDDGNEHFIREDSHNPYDYTFSLAVAYSSLINGKTVTYIARCSFFSYYQDIEFQVTGISYTSDLKVVESYCPDYVFYDEEATLAVSANASYYTCQWYVDDGNGFVELDGENGNSLIIPANSYRRHGYNNYMCRIDDGYSQVDYAFMLYVNHEDLRDRWRASAEHKMMTPGGDNRLYITCYGNTFLDYISPEVQWSRWNPEQEIYEDIDGANDYEYLITSQESSDFEYGEIVTYRCRITNPPLGIVDAVVQVGVTALKDTQITESYYLDFENSYIDIKAWDCEAIDPDGFYDYQWTIEGTEDSYYPLPTELNEDGPVLRLYSDDIEIEGEYLVTCRTYDARVGLSSLFRAYVYYNQDQAIKTFYQSKVGMDYINGNDLEVIAVGRNGTYQTDEMEYQWYRGDTILTGERESVLHVSPEEFELGTTYTCVVTNIGTDFNKSCQFTLFGNTPERTGQEQNGEYDLSDCEFVWDLSERNCTQINYSILPYFKYAFAIRGVTTDYPEGVYQITISGVENLQEFEVALYDDNYSRRDIVTGGDGGTMWIQYEHYGSTEYYLVLMSKATQTRTQTISFQRVNAPAPQAITVYGGGAEFRLVDSTDPVVFAWADSKEDSFSHSVRFYVDGRMIEENEEQNSMIPYIQYDLDGDRVEHITFKVSDGNYWYETTRDIYFRTLLLDYGNGDLTDRIKSSMNVSRDQEVRLTADKRLASGTYGLIERGEIHNLAKSISYTWYSMDSLWSQDISGKTPIGTGINYVPDTSEYGISYYMVVISNGIDTCTVGYQVNVLDTSVVPDNEIHVSGLSLSLFSNGLLNLNTYVQIPSSIDSYQLMINGVDVGELDVYGTLQDGYSTYSVFKISYTITPAELGTDQKLVVSRKDGEVLLDTAYAAVDYLDIYLNDENYLETYANYSRYQGLVKNLIRYGQAAKNYFGNEGDKSIIALLPRSQSRINEVSQTIWSQYQIQDDYLSCMTEKYIPGIQYYGSSLLLKSGTTLRHYFMLEDDRNIHDYVFSCEGTTLTPIKKGSLYYVDIVDIPVYDLDHAYQVEVQTQEESTIKNGSFSYSAMNYLNKWKSTENKTSEERNLINALVWYHRNWPGKTFRQYGGQIQT